MLYHTSGTAIIAPSTVIRYWSSPTRLYRPRCTWYSISEREFVRIDSGSLSRVTSLKRYPSFSAAWHSAS